jgi:ribose 5-phosphate isomerase B
VLLDRHRASIATDKVAGARAALCVDAYTADGARRWNDANVSALCLRLTSDVALGEILDAGLPDEPSAAASIAPMSPYRGDLRRITPCQEI